MKNVASSSFLKIFERSCVPKSVFNDGGRRLILNMQLKRNVAICKIRRRPHNANATWQTIVRNRPTKPEHRPDGENYIRREPTKLKPMFGRKNFAMSLDILRRNGCNFRLSIGSVVHIAGVKG